MLPSGRPLKETWRERIAQMSLREDELCDEEFNGQNVYNAHNLNARQITFNGHRQTALPRGT